MPALAPVDKALVPVAACAAAPGEVGPDSAPLVTCSPCEVVVTDPDGDPVEVDVPGEIEDWEKEPLFEVDAAEAISPV